MSKPKSETWNHCKVIDDTTIECNYCGEKRRNNITKFKDHLNKCRKFLKEQSQSSSNEPSGQSTILSFVEEGKEKVKEQFKDLITKAMISGNVSFRFVNNFYLQKALSLIKVNLPKDTTFRTVQVDKVHKEANDWIDKCIRESPVVNIRFDSFKNVNSDSLTSIVIKTLNETIYYKSILPDERQDHNYYAKILEDVIEEVGKLNFLLVKKLLN